MIPIKPDSGINTDYVPLTSSISVIGACAKNELACTKSDLKVKKIISTSEFCVILAVPLLVAFR